MKPITSAAVGSGMTGMTEPSVATRQALGRMITSLVVHVATPVLAYCLALVVLADVGAVRRVSLAVVAWSAMAAAGSYGYSLVLGIARHEMSERESAWRNYLTMLVMLAAGGVAPHASESLAFGSRLADMGVALAAGFILCAACGSVYRNATSIRRSLAVPTSDASQVA